MNLQHTILKQRQRMIRMTKDNKNESTRLKHTKENKNEYKPMKQYYLYPLNELMC